MLPHQTGSARLQQKPFLLCSQSPRLFGEKRPQKEPAVWLFFSAVVSGHRMVILSINGFLYMRLSCNSSTCNCNASEATTCGSGLQTLGTKTVERPWGLPNRAVLQTSIIVSATWCCVCVWSRFHYAQLSAGTVQLPGPWPPEPHSPSLPPSHSSLQRRPPVDKPLNDFY